MQEQSNVPSHQQLQLRISQEEKKIHNILAILIVIFIVVIGLLIGHRIQNTINKNNIKEEVKKEIFDKLEQEQKNEKSKVMEELQYIKYNKLLNLTNITFYLKNEISQHIKEIEQDYLKDFKKYSIKNRLKRNLTELDQKLKNYLHHELLLKQHYNDGIQMSELLYRTYFEYENCKKNIKLEKDQLLISTLDFQRKKMEEIREDAEQLDMQKEIELRNQIQQDELIKLKKEMDFIRQEIIEIEMSSKVSKEIENELKDKINQNNNIDDSLMQFKSEITQLEFQIQKIQEKIEELQKENIDLNISVKKYEKQIEYIQLEIKDKTLDSNINKILRDMGVSQSLNKEIELAQVIKQKLNFQEKIAKMKLNTMTDQEIENTQREIRESQQKYREIMIIVNQLKRKAFLYKQESIQPFIDEKNKIIQQKINQMQRYTNKIKSNEDYILQLMNELNQKQQRLKYLRELILRLQQTKEENLILINKYKDTPSNRFEELEIMRNRYNQLETKYYNLIQEMKENKNKNQDEKNKEKKQKDNQLISKLKDHIVDYLNDLNIKIGQCKQKEQQLIKYIKNSDKQHELIKNQLIYLRDVQNHIQILLKQI